MRREEKRSNTPVVPTTIPDDWAPTDKHRAKATDLRLDCDREAEAFRDNARSRGRKYVDWDAAFNTWLRNARKFADERAAKSQPTLGSWS